MGGEGVMPAARPVSPIPHLPYGTRHRGSGALPSKGNRALLFVGFSALEESVVGGITTQRLGKLATDNLSNGKSSLGKGSLGRFPRSTKRQHTAVLLAKWTENAWQPQGARRRLVDHEDQPQTTRHQPRRSQGSTMGFAKTVCFANPLKTGMPVTGQRLLRSAGSWGEIEPARKPGGVESAFVAHWLRQPVVLSFFSVGDWIIGSGFR